MDLSGWDLDGPISALSDTIASQSRQDLGRYREPEYSVAPYTTAATLLANRGLKA